jgi:hypothetical protein
MRTSDAEIRGPSVLDTSGPGLIIGHENDKSAITTPYQGIKYSLTGVPGVWLKLECVSNRVGE